MKHLIIIQARCGSSRLPGKVLKDLCGKTALERVIERCQQARSVDEVVVATTSNKQDLKIVKLVSAMKVRVFVGSSGDVLDRYYQVAKLLRPEYIIRITSDCPMIDPDIIDDMVDTMHSDSDYIAGISETLADGLDVEIMTYAALKKSWKEATLAHEREHVTMYIKNHPELFKIQDYRCKLGNLHDHRWTLDEPEDYEMLRRSYIALLDMGKENFRTKDVLEMLGMHPEILKINKGFIRNEGLQISLKNDHIVNLVD